MLKIQSQVRDYHRCEAGAIIKNARNLLRKGELHVLILSDLPIDLEEESRSTDGAFLWKMEVQKPVK